jgi:hypothetical protein
MISVWLAALVTSLLARAAPAPQADRYGREFVAAAPGEAIAVVVAGCVRCDWGESGREAAALRVSVDGKYSQHILLARGEAAAEYRVSLGTVSAGRHRLTVERDAAQSAAGAGPATIDVRDVLLFPDDGSEDTAAKSMAPILYARPDTVGRFTDLPLFMWYEVVPTARGRQFRYSVIFSNEDGGTPTDRLMATWGRTTDIEFVYGVELDEKQRVLAEEFQGPGHEVPPFKGRHEARHPLQWVSTENNMVSESGRTRVRYAPAPVKFDLAGVSREAVMDAQPWVYAVMAKELAREGKIVADAPPGNKQISDPRRFVYVEACGEVGTAALAFTVGVRDTWIPSDRGMRQYRIVRDGCFRAAIPLPAGTRAADLRGIRALAYDRPPAEGKPPVAPTPIRLTSINKLFLLDEQFVPGQTLLTWRGSALIQPGGAPFEVNIP